MKVSDLIFNKDKTSYINLIQSIEGKLLTFKEVVEENVKSDKFFCLRHDIDDKKQLRQCLTLASLECQRGWKSTYFLRYFSNFFKFSDDFIEVCKEFIKLGHDLGLHIDIVDSYIKETKNVKKSLLKPLTFLRNNGIEIKGVSAHGTPTTYKTAFNYEFWKEFKLNKYDSVGKVKFKKISLRDLDLVYETYFIGHDFYLTDSRGVWTGWVVNKDKILPYESNMIKNKNNIGKKVIKKFNKSKEGFFQVLIHSHPNRWTII